MSAAAHPTWFAALEHAHAARRVYPPDHPVAARALQDACSALSETVTKGESQAYLLGDRMLVSGHVTRVDPHGDSLANALMRRKITCLRVTGAPSAESLAAFLDNAAKVCERSLIAPDGLALGEATSTAHRAGISSVTAQAFVARQHTGTVQAGLGVLWERGEIDLSPLLAVVEEVQAVASGARGTMIEMAALKSHDEYTYVHAVNVGLLAACLAEAAGLPSELVRDIALSALMHDAGKRVISLDVLGKKGALTDDERALMQTHPVEGAALLMGAPGVPALAPIVAYEHHMHLDGTGYPSPLPGRKPHIGSQIVQIADVFDALRTHRPYRPSMPLVKATEVLRSGGGTRYDTRLLDAFFTHVVPRTSREQEGAQPGTDAGQPLAA